MYVNVDAIDYFEQLYTVRTGIKIWLKGKTRPIVIQGLTPDKFVEAINSAPDGIIQLPVEIILTGFEKLNQVDALVKVDTNK